MREFDQEDQRCATLWRRVILQALSDATLPKRSVVRDRARAIIFSTTGVTATWFSDICHLVSIEPGTFRQKTREMIDQGIRFVMRVDK